MSIKILSPQLISQIAAGEIIERPASVVKELMENSIDSGANNININIEKGGTKLIHINDNGSGINKEELTLALMRHATSKITSIDDLESIISFGFRGEALASIKSVSRLTLTSRTFHQHEGWQVYVEGNDMNVMLKPVAHPYGTSVEVKDLFYNKPARRKFMYTEKTEFLYIIKIVRRIALAHFNVSISLHHNNKLINYYRIINNETHHNHRLSNICGVTFMKHAIPINIKDKNISLYGWISLNIKDDKSVKLRFCYINKRIIDDKLINHAINHVLDIKFNGKQASYVLYLEIDPYEIDTNIHPTKLKVRFYRPRIVHDFICQAIISTLKEKMYLLSGLKNTKHEICQKLETYQIIKHDKLTFNKKIKHHEHSKYASENFQLQKILSNNLSLLPTINIQPQIISIEKNNCLLTILYKKYALVKQVNELFLISLPVAYRYLKQKQLNDSGCKSKQLIIPMRLEITGAKEKITKNNSDLLKKIGINLYINNNSVIVRAMPVAINIQNLEILIKNLLSYLSKHQEFSIKQLINWLAEYASLEIKHWDKLEANSLLVELKQIYPRLFIFPPLELLQNINIYKYLNF